MQLRAESAVWLNNLNRDYLFERYGITRVGNITGFDTIGIPVYNAIRPTASVLSVNSGKGLDAQSARAGAIAEAIEYGVFERPVGKFQLGPFDWVDPELLPLARDSKWTPQMSIPLEYVTHFASGERRLFPSDLLWMVHRRQKRMSFQMTSNGQAVGYSFEDAFLGGIYEVVERDALALRLYALDQVNVFPRRVQLSPVLEPLPSMIGSASLKLYLFYCTVDVPLPVYWAILIDPVLGGFFTTWGWGCDIDQLKAARKAILEAIQSRCVYIAGARDDLLEGDYNEHRARDPLEQIAFLDGVPFSHTLEVSDWEPLDIGEELEVVLSRLGLWQKNIYFNCVDLNPLFAVKTVILGLEPPRNALWVPSKRSTTWVQACTDVVQRRYAANAGALQRSLAMCCEMFSRSDQNSSA